MSEALEMARVKANGDKHLIVLTCGEAVGDPEGLVAGRRQRVLTAVGRRQMLLASSGLKDYCLRQEVDLNEAVWLVSPMARAVQSLWQVIAGLRKLGCEPRQVNLCNEDGMAALDAGSVTGWPLCNVLRLYPQVQHDTEFAWPGGESLCNVQTRATQCLQQHLLRDTGRVYVAITHRAVWAALLAPSLDKGLEPGVLEPALQLALEPRHARFAAYTFRNPDGYSTLLDLTELRG